MKRTVSLSVLLSLAFLLAFGLVLITWATSSTPLVAAQATSAPQATPTPATTPSPGAPTNPTISSVEEALGTFVYGEPANAGQDRQQCKVWISGALTYLDTASSNAFTVALTNVLQGVEDRREAIQSPLRKLCRWIAKKLHIKQEARASDCIILPLNPANIARVLLQRDDLHRDEEISRLRTLHKIKGVCDVRPNPTQGLISTDRA